MSKFIIPALLIALAAVSTCNRWSQQQLLDNGAAVGSSMAELQATIEQRHRSEQESLKRALAENARQKQQLIEKQRTEQAGHKAVWDEIERLQKLEAAK
jgi:hypothetical protein